MNPATQGWDEAGRLVCRTCLSMGVVQQANATIEERDPTSGRNLYFGAFSALGLGIGTCCLSTLGQWFFLLSLAVVLNGGWVALHVLRNPETKAQLGSGYWLVLIVSIVGTLFGLLAFCLGMLRLVAEGMFRSGY